MKREELKALGLADEVIDTIMESHGKDLNKHKTAAETAKAEADALKAQLGEANTTIEGFKKLDIDGIKAAADDWKSKAENAERDSAEKLYNFKLDSRLEKTLKEEFKARNPRRIMQDLDRSMLKYDEAKDLIVGNLADQIAPIKEKEGYLFDGEQPEAKLVTKTNSQPVNKSALESAFDKGAGIKE